MTENVMFPILSVSALKVYFPSGRAGFRAPQRWVKAVDGVDFRIMPGSTLGLVGESGSGKTTVGRAILRLIPATAGMAMFQGSDLFKLSARDMRAVRPRIQIVFQDPMSSLDPRMTVRDIITESLTGRGGLSRSQREHAAAELLERVGLSTTYVKRYPHEFSGGQRQRLGIARALASKPAFIVCDEPVSALDVSIQAQILNLLSDLQRDLGIAYLFIAHNLAVVEHFAHDIAVMYLGRIVERAPRDRLYDRPLHPYTRALLSAVPSADPDARSQRQLLAGETPSPINPPCGCRFHPRCPIARAECAMNAPELLEKEPDHFVRCPYTD